MCIPLVANLLIARHIVQGQVEQLVGRETEETHGDDPSVDSDAFDHSHLYRPLPLLRLQQVHPAYYAGHEAVQGREK